MEKLNENDYKNFTESDFIADPYFQDWVMKSNIENEIFWKTFFERNTSKKKAGELARNFLINIRFREDPPEEDVIKRSLENHLNDIKILESRRAVDIKRRWPIRKLLAIAATFGGVLLIISALFIFYKVNNPVLVRTEYGETRSAVLPDSSLVVLNANSNIEFNRKWGKSSSREVWLQGEAFFNVRHINRDSSKIQTYERFVVHTEELTIEVLGTSFDIRQRRGKTEVVLQTGKINVSFNDRRRRDIIMKPGDLLTYNGQEKTVKAGTTSAENFSAWKERKLILDDPTTSEIVEYLEDNFGKSIILENPELGKRKIEGPILLTNLDDALFVLSTVLNTEIIKKDNTINIRSR